MNRALLIFSLLSLSHLFAEPPVTRRKVLIPAVPGADAGARIAAMPARPDAFLTMGGDVLTLKTSAAGTTLVDSKGAILYTIAAPESVLDMWGHVVSPAGTSALICIYREGYYRRLVRVRRINGSLKFDDVWPHGTKLFGERRWWIARVGAISDDGATVLAEFGIEPDGGIGLMGYEWQTWTLEPAKKLGAGLTVANGRVGQ